MHVSTQRFYASRAVTSISFTVSQTGRIKIKVICFAFRPGRGCSRIRSRSREFCSYEDRMRRETRCNDVERNNTTGHAVLGMTIIRNGAIRCKAESPRR